MIDEFSKNVISRYINFEKNDLLCFESLLKRKTFKSGEIIQNLEDIVDRLYIIQKGVAKSYFINNSNNKFLWQVYFNNKTSNIINIFVVDYYSFVNRFKTNIEIIATEDCELLYLEYSDLQWYYSNVKNSEQLGENLSKHFYSHLHNRLINKLTLDLNQRYERLKKFDPFIFSLLPQFDIASYIGVTPQSLSRIKKKIDLN